MYGFSSSGILHVEYVVGIRNHFAIHNHIESRVGARIENAIVEKETHNGGNFRWVSIESVPIKLIQTGFRIGLKPQPVFRIHAYLKPFRVRTVGIVRSIVRHLIPNDFLKISCIGCHPHVPLGIGCDAIRMTDANRKGFHLVRGTIVMIGSRTSVSEENGL